MITAEIKLNDQYLTKVSGQTIQEIIDKIIELHTMDSFERNHYIKHGILDQELKTGWYYEKIYV